MTVGQLRNWLTQFIDQTPVYEARDGEHRELRKEDVKFMKQINDNDSGGVQTRQQGFVVFGAWS